MLRKPVGLDGLALGVLGDAEQREREGACILGPQVGVYVRCVAGLSAVCLDSAGPVEEPDTNKQLRAATKDPRACRAGLGVDLEAVVVHSPASGGLFSPPRSWSRRA